MTVMVLKALRTSVFHVEHEVDPLILGFSVPCLLWHRKQFARKAGYVRAKDQSGWETFFMQSQKCLCPLGGRMVPHPSSFESMGMVLFSVGISHGALCC